MWNWHLAYITAQPLYRFNLQLYFELTDRTDAWFLNAQRRLGCRLSILEALEPTATTTCPPEDQLINCFWVS